MSEQTDIITMTPEYYARKARDAEDGAPPAKPQGRPRKYFYDAERISNDITTLYPTGV